MYKKINLYVNKEYICSSNGYRTCREFKEKVLHDGFVEWASVPGLKRMKIKSADRVQCYFAKD